MSALRSQRVNNSSTKSSQTSDGLHVQTLPVTFFAWVSRGISSGYCSWMGDQLCPTLAHKFKQSLANGKKWAALCTNMVKEAFERLLPFMLE